MPEAFENILREGTEQFLASVDPPAAAELRVFGARRARRRQARSFALCAAALLVIGGTTAGVARLSGPEGGPAVAASTKSAASTHPHPMTPLPEPTGPVGVSIQGPATYAAQTANRVEVTLSNPLEERAVIVEFDTTGTGIFEWAEGCDSGSDNGCTDTNLADNPLHLTQGALGRTTSQATRFSLTLPNGTHTYEAWVDPPRGASTFSVRVLDAKGQRVLGSAQSAPVATGFPTQKLAGQASTSIARGGGYVEFATTVANQTGGGYIHLDQYGTVSCSANGSPVSVSAKDYSLQWNTDGDSSHSPSWAELVNGEGMGAMGYDLHTGASVTTQLRLKLNSSLPSEVTSCEVTLTIVNTVRTSPPYFNASDPQSHAVAEFVVH